VYVELRLRQGAPLVVRTGSAQVDAMYSHRAAAKGTLEDAADIVRDGGTVKVEALDTMELIKLLGGEQHHD
jgi:hypothetical protein